MTDISKEAVERLWKEYCDASTSTGVLPGGIEEFDVDEMNNRAFDLFEHAKALQARVEELEARADLPAAVAVKPLEWDGLVSGPYEIVLDASVSGHCTMADLYFYGNRDEDGEPEHLRGGYVTLISIDELKEVAQKHHAEQMAKLVNVTPAPVPVKPLNWREQSDREYWYSADGFGVKYEVKEIGLSKWWLSINGEMLTVPFELNQTAREAAQGHHERRILSTLADAPVPGEQPDAVQEATEIDDAQIMEVTERVLHDMGEAQPAMSKLHHRQFLKAALRALTEGE
jgi:hypothetical protein